MLEALNDLDTTLFLALNGSLPSLDRAMWWVSQPLFWMPLYAVMVWSCKSVLGTWKQRAMVAACLVLCVAGTDAISARVLKPRVERLRPSHEPSLAGQVHLLEERPGELYRGGRFGFVSSHAANHMGVAVFFSGLLGGGWTWGLLAWAFLIGYSRIHLGVHYPGDVLGGFVVGWGVGSLAWVLARRGQQLFPLSSLESRV